MSNPEAGRRPGGEQPPPGPGRISRARLRTPRAAAVAGIIFALLLGLALVLITVSSPARPATVGAWLTYSSRRDTLVLALNLVPFAGIAFLWFIGVVRDRIGDSEDQFFGSVFLGSGLLFVAMLFAAAGVAGGLVADPALRSGAIPGPEILAFGRGITGNLLQTYAMRMAAVFTMSTSTITLRTRVASVWISRSGIVVAAILLISVGLSPWVELLFPAWILLFSLDILNSGLRSSPGRRTGPGRGDPA